MTRECANCKSIFTPQKRTDRLCPDCMGIGGLFAGRNQKSLGGGYKTNTPLANKWRHSPRFLRLRREHLTAFPYCVRCGKLGYVLDHKIPHKNDYKLFWSQDNWQTLCKKCHDFKTLREDI